MIRACMRSVQFHNSTLVQHGYIGAASWLLGHGTAGKGPGSSPGQGDKVGHSPEVAGQGHNGGSGPQIQTQALLWGTWSQVHPQHCWRPRLELDWTPGRGMRLIRAIKGLLVLAGPWRKQTANNFSKEACSRSIFATVFLSPLWAVLLCALLAHYFSHTSFSA